MAKRRKVTVPPPGRFVAGVTLYGRPPEQWMVARGYGRMTSEYYVGGRWTSGGSDRFVLSISGDKARREMNRHYAYERATGKTLGRHDLPFSAQFDYTGSARRGEAKRAQLLRLVGV